MKYCNIDAFHSSSEHLRPCIHKAFSPIVSIQPFFWYFSFDNWLCSVNQSSIIPCRSAVDPPLEMTKIVDGLFFFRIWILFDYTAIENLFVSVVTKCYAWFSHWIIDKCENFSISYSYIFSILYSYIYFYFHLATSLSIQQNCLSLVTMNEFIFLFLLYIPYFYIIVIYYYL